MPGSTAQTNKYHTFYLQQRQDNGDTWADIKVNHPLDYETIKEYNLTIRVEVSDENQLKCLLRYFIVLFRSLLPHLYHDDGAIFLITPHKILSILCIEQIHSVNSN